MKELIISGSKCDIIRQQRSSSFVCIRCWKQKVSKIHGEFVVDGVSHKICNACYGYLLSDITEGVKQVELDLEDTPEIEVKKRGQKGGLHKTVLYCFTVMA